MEQNLEWKTSVLIKVIYKTRRSCAKVVKKLVFHLQELMLGVGKNRLSRVLTVVLRSLAGRENDVHLTPRKIPKFWDNLEFGVLWGRMNLNELKCVKPLDVNCLIGHLSCGS